MGGSLSAVALWRRNVSFGNLTPVPQLSTGKPCFRTNFISKTSFNRFTTGAQKNWYLPADSLVAKFSNVLPSSTQSNSAFRNTRLMIFVRRLVFRIAKDNAFYRKQLSR
jgi:hypothetical protein